MPAALRHPEWIHAYVGIGQVISVEVNERLSFEYALAEAKREQNQEAIDDLEAIAPYPGDDAPKLSPLYSEADRTAINQGNVLTLGRILE